MDAITGIQISLARKAKEVPTHRFGDMWPLLCREEWIRDALSLVLSNQGGRTAGIDGQTREALKDEKAINQFVNELRAELKAKTFKPSPVRRVYIPKPNGKLRPLGIPTIRDRVVQMLLKMTLEPIWESDFLNCSSGFRVGRRTMDCIWSVYQMTYPKSRMYWAVEGDIKGYFDTIHHAKMLDLVEKRIQDPRILRLIEQFLTAGVMEKHLFQRTEAGTPQGGIVSPLLANIYLHELDRYWWENHGDLTWTERWGRRQRRQGNNHLIRYADDFLVLTNGTSAEAERLREEFGEFLRGELKLELSPEKTLITHVNDGYDFLGFHIRRYVRPKEGTKPVVLVKPSEKGMDRFKDKVRQLTATDRIAHPLDTLRAYNRLAAGWGNYYRFVNSKDIFVELDHWAFNRLLFWFARHHGVGPMRAWEQYVHLQPGRNEGTTRKNLAVKDDTGRRLYCYKMADLQVRRYSRKRMDNPYLSGEVETTISAPETPTLEGSWTGGSTSDGASYRGERLAKLEEAGYRCERCGGQENLDLHHRKAAKGRDRTTLHHPSEWLEILCENCHAATFKQNG
jgi:group II intron reverse transcriptase/maturase